MKNDQLVTSKIAYLAKEKGFDLRTKSYYIEEKLIDYATTMDGVIVESWDHNHSFLDRASAPTIQELQDWLREEFEQRLRSEEGLTKLIKRLK